MQGLYKKRYGIGLYKRIRKAGDTDMCVALFDSAEEFAEFIGKSLKCAYDILRLHYSKGQQNIRVNNDSYELAFIDYSEE